MSRLVISPIAAFACRLENAIIASNPASDSFESDCNAADATALPTNRERRAWTSPLYCCALPTPAACGSFVPATWESPMRLAKFRQHLKREVRRRVPSQSVAANEETRE